MTPDAMPRAGVPADVVVVSAVRSAIGTYGGALKDVPATRLAATVLREAVTRARIDPASVGHVVFGSVVPGEARDLYLSRVAALEGGLQAGTPCLTLNRLCGSGLQAIISAAQSIQLGDCDVAIGGGAESMSRAAYFLPAARWGQRMGDAAAVDAMTGALHDPFGHGHMGVTAENIAERFAITRAEQDAYALASHRRASQAQRAGHFQAQIVPVEIKTRQGTSAFSQDEHIRHDAVLTDFERLKPAFKQDGTVTAGNASGLNDAAAALLLMQADAATAAGCQPLARLVGYAHAGVEPQLMGLGPIPAVRRLFEKTGLSPSQMDVIESNEAFAVQALCVTRELGLDPSRVNADGGAVALGHPIGATGAILSVKAIHALHRCAGRYALVTLCIGGGQGIAAIFERC